MTENSQKRKENFNALLWRLMTGVGILFCCIVLGFLLFGSSEQFQVSRVSIIFMAVFSFFAPIAVMALVRGAFPQMEPGLRRRALYGAAAFILVFFVVKVPFSPGHDSYDMMGFLEQALAGKGYSDYARAYLSFTATNRITMFFYLPLVFLFRSVEAGVRVTHFLLLTGSVLLIAESCRRLFSEKTGEIAVYVLLVFCPYVLLVGPYIYLPAIFLSALAFYLLHRRGLVFKITGVFVCGLLYLLRPLALGWILIELVLFFWTGSYKHRFLRGIGVAAGIFACCLVLHMIFAGVLYYTGLYPYRQLQTSAGIWTLELGTRWQEEETGTCTYSGYSEPGFDGISEQFHNLWQLYAREDEQDQEQLLQIQSQIRSQILQRSRQTILADFPSFWKFLTVKFVNYFADDYRPYYYIPNINSPDIEKNLVNHYEKQYFLYENMLLAAFYAAALVALLCYFIFPQKQKRLLGLLIGVFATVGLSILATEVGKRLLFDVFVPMMLVLCAQAGSVYQKISQKISGSQKNIPGVWGVAVLLLVLGIQGFYHQYRFTIFSGSEIDVTEERIVLRLKTAPREHILVQQGEQTQDFFEQLELIFPNKPGNDTHFLRFVFPDGEEYFVAKLRRQK